MEHSATKNLTIWTVDAFTNQPFSGNPAAVVIVKDFPSDEICQNIATEMNLSETVFLKALGLDHFHIRWFTPTVEVDLCGHATLAAAHILFTEGEVVGQNIAFDSLSGSLFVTRSDAKITLNFPLQPVSGLFSSSELYELFNPTTIVQAVRAHDDVIVELTDEQTVRNLVLDTAIVNRINCRGLIVTAKGSHPYDIVSRFFAPRVGVPEDPVTGSAHCKLADYWQKKLGKTELQAYQASSRGGIILIKIDGYRVYLTGTAITMMKGQLCY